jgi:ABC-2 type transport system ATP-binding protein
MKETVLKLTNISKTYGSQKALDKVSMQVYQGDIYGLIGKNGAGKSTIQRMVTGLGFADSGEIELFGKSNPKDLQNERARVAAIIETPPFYPNLSAAQNLEYYQKLRGIADKQAINKLLTMVGLAEVGKKKFKSFSLGMKQRLGIALCLLTNPDLLILDEPINGLDPTGIVEIRDLIEKLNREYNVTILISSHILSELQMVATRYGIIDKGRMLAELSKEELDEQCQRSLSIRTNDAAKAASVLETQLATSNYKIINPNELRLYDFLDEAAEVNTQLVRNGVSVLGIAEVGDNLENYFMNLTQGGAVNG